MEFRMLRKLQRNAVLPFVRTAMGQLRKDYEMNMAHRVFEAWPGEPISFEDFVAMVLIEKDITLKLKERGHG